MEFQTAQTRRARHRREARRAILDATATLLQRDGPDALSIRKVAERCGFSPPAIYHYFRDKDALIDALLEERFQGLVSAAPARRDGEDDVAHLHALAQAFLSFGLRNQDLYRLLNSAAHNGRVRQIPAAEEMRARLRAPFERLAAAGRLRTDDVDAAVQATFALLHGITALRINSPKAEFAPELDQTAIAALLRGLADAPPQA